MQDAVAAHASGTWSIGASGGGLLWDTWETRLAGRHSVAQHQEEPDQDDEQAAGDEEARPVGALTTIFARSGITHATWLLSLIKTP